MGTAGIMAGCGLAAALLRAHLRKAALLVQGGDPAVEGGPERQGPRVRRYVDDWVAWACAGAGLAAANPAP